MQKRVKEQEQPVFFLPDILNHEDFNKDEMSKKGKWMLKDNSTKQVVFDLRSAVQKALQKEFQSETSFKKDLDVWEDKPRIIASEDVKEKSRDKPNSVVQLLAPQELVVVIVSTSEPNRAKFAFFEAYPPFSKKEQEFSVPKVKRNSSKTIPALLVTDLRPEHVHDPHSFLAVVDDHETCKLVRFTYDAVACRFEDPLVHLHAVGKGIGSDSLGLVGCYHLEGDKLLLITTETTTVLSAIDLQPLTTHYHKQLIDSAYSEYGKSYLCKPDHGAKSFLIVFDKAFSIPTHIRPAHEVKGTLNYDSWIGRFTFVQEENELIRSTGKHDSLLLRGELVTAMLEFAPNRLLVATETSHLILFHDWVRIRVYSDTSPQHSLKAKGYLTTLPGFDIASFPFVAQAGDKSINLINLREASSEPLILAETTCLRG